MDFLKHQWIQNVRLKDWKTEATVERGDVEPQQNVPKHRLNIFLLLKIPINSNVSLLKVDILFDQKSSSNCLELCGT